MNELDYPSDAICETCHHAFEQHDVAEEPVIFQPIVFKCWDCIHGGDFVRHNFAPKRLAAGTLSPSQERAAYEKAMRGE